MHLWIWHWQLVDGRRVPVGYNSCKAATREEALAYGNSMSDKLRVNEDTLHEGTYAELAKLDREYASLFN